MITIVDYQMGNLRSVQKAVERVGGDAIITSDPSKVAAADALILPGVGAFGDAMAEINRRDLAQPIRDFVQTGRPFLGICLGLQLLFEQGYEHGTHRGLEILPGDVQRFELPNDYKVPHMGWNTVRQTAPSAILDSVVDGAHFYFVHSYYVVPADDSVTSLSCEYGHDFCAMVTKNNLFATQFHPEKSQANGLRLLRAFHQLTETSQAGTLG
ncbi:MAG: imidazole glycerol phosphate synthase subunit HisH [Planctomycetota bacterium]